MPGAVLISIFDKTAAVFAAIQDAGKPLFGASRVFKQGSAATTALPQVRLGWAEEQSDGGLQPTGKIGHRLPWTAEIHFDETSLASGEEPADAHARIYGLAKDAVMNNRSLTGAVVDTRYIGGGTALEPVDTEAGPARWRFPLRFESLYRHADTSTDIPA